MKLFPECRNNENGTGLAFEWEQCYYFNSLPLVSTELHVLHKANNQSTEQV